MNSAHSRRTMSCAAGLVLLLAVAGCPATQASSAADADSVDGPSTDIDQRSDGAAGADLGPLRPYDVVVVGGGTGGTAAAIQAARLGMKVALVEETDWVGGQMTAAGVTSMDTGGHAPAEASIYGEFIRAVRAYYADPLRFPPAGKSIATCYWSQKSAAFEPHIGKQVLEKMLAEAKVELFLRSRVVSVLKTGSTVDGVTLADGRRLASKVLVDATEYGDVIPLAGVEYRVGNSLGSAIKPTSCIQDITYLAVIKRYPAGVPSALQIKAPPPGYAKAKAIFETVVAAGGAPPPVKWPLAYPVGWALHHAYRGMPDSTNPRSYTAIEPTAITKTGVNFANDYHGHKLTYVAGKPVGAWLGPLGVDYLENRAKRRAVDCAAKLRTLNFIYYLQTNGQPLWSISTDEGYDTAYNREENSCANIPAALKPLEAHLPVMPYVRESRRIVPIRTLTAKEIKRVGTPPRAATRFESSIAVGDYMTDLHNCRDQLEADLAEVEADNSTGGSFQVPLETLIPAQIDGFVAAEKNIGVTRLTAGAIREQPITMYTGLAAGTLAALAARAGLQPRQVKAIDVQRELLAAGSPLSVLHFDDVHLTHAQWAAVELTTLYGLMVGKSASLFGVDEMTTRAQAAVVVAHLFGLDLKNPSATPTFADVATTHGSYAAIEALYKAGYTSGCATSPPKFCPDKQLSRGELAVFLCRGLGLDPGAAPQVPVFSDVPASHPFFGFVQQVGKAQIIKGCGVGLFCPDTPLSRGTFAEAVAQTLYRTR